MLTSVQELQRSRQPPTLSISRQDELQRGWQPPPLPTSRQDDLQTGWQPPPLPTSRQDAPPTSFSSSVSCTPTNMILSSGALEARFQLLQERQQEHNLVLQAQREEYLAAIQELRGDIAQARIEIQELRCKSTSAPSVWAGRQKAYSGLKDQIAPNFGERQSAYNDVKGSSLSCYTFGPSIWDAALLCFFREVCLADKIILVVGMLINHGLQSILLAVVHFDMLDNPVPLEKATHMLEWRASVGHSLGEFDDVKGESLIHKLCTHSLWSFEQSEYEVMYQYLFMPIPGYVLSLLALILWVLTTTREYRNVMEQALALFNLPSVARGESSIVKEEDGLRITGIETWGRWVALLVLCLPRLAIDVMICIVGCQYLAQTPSLENIVLNAVALAFVLDVDEQLYDVLCTQRIRKMVEDLAPLPCARTSTKCMGSLQWKDLIRYALCVGAIVTAYILYLVPFYHHVNGAANALCGGEYDFHFQGGSPTQSMIWVHNHTDFHGSCSDDYLPRYHPAYSGHQFEEYKNTTSDALVEARRRVVLNYAYSKGCGPGQVLEPKNAEKPNRARVCSRVPPVLADAIDELTRGVHPGAVGDPPRCNQFAPDQEQNTCTKGNNGTEACLWTSLSSQCEGPPPGNFHRWACSKSSGPATMWRDVEQSCDVWTGYNLTSPYYNCRVLEVCNDTRVVHNCFVLRGDMYYDVIQVDGFDLPTSMKVYYDTAQLALVDILDIPNANVQVGPHGEQTHEKQYVRPFVPGPSTSPPGEGHTRVAMRYTITCPVTFKPEAFFQGDYERELKEAIIELVSRANATIGQFLQTSIMRVSMNNTRYLSKTDYTSWMSLLRHHTENSPGAGGNDAATSADPN